MDTESMIQTARALVAPRQGHPRRRREHADDREATDGDRPRVDRGTRRAYREMLFTTPGVGEYISGVILFDETIRQRPTTAHRSSRSCAARASMPGIKVDAGTKPLAGFPDEVVTEGLDGLRDRLEEYATLGARFAKWRAVIRDRRRAPDSDVHHANAHALARYAALVQEAGLVPIVEPEVLMDGTHNLRALRARSRARLSTPYTSSSPTTRRPRGTLLKPNMVLPGKDCPDQADDEEIADPTIRVLRQSVPAAVPGIVFLSGGLSDEQATARLDANNAGATTLGAELLLRPRAAGPRAACLVRRLGQPGQGPGRPAPPSASNSAARRLRTPPRHGARRHATKLTCPRSNQVSPNVTNSGALAAAGRGRPAAPYHRRGLVRRSERRSSAFQTSAAPRGNLNGTLALADKHPNQRAEVDAPRRGISTPNWVSPVLTPPDVGRVGDGGAWRPRCGTQPRAGNR